MTGVPITLHGVVRRGVVMIDEDVKLPEGTPVKVVVAAEDLPQPLRSELTEAGPTDAGTDAEPWERQE